MFIYISILIMSVVGFFIHLLMSRKVRTPVQVAELLIIYQLIFTISLSSFLAFFGLTFMRDFVAHYTDWDSCRFQELLGNVNLSYGILGLLALKIRGNFWVAIILGQSIWLLADAVTHILDIYQNGNYAPGNAGVPLFTDILIPVMLLTSLGVFEYLKTKEKKQKFKEEDG